jgi:hypothetical protein
VGVVELVEKFVDDGYRERVLEGVEDAVLDVPPRTVGLLERIGEEKGESLRRTTPCLIIAAH